MIVFVIISEGRFINQTVVINLIKAETAVYHQTSIRYLYIELKYNKLSLDLCIQTIHISMIRSHIKFTRDFLTRH